MSSCPHGVEVRANCKTCRQTDTRRRNRAKEAAAQKRVVKPRTMTKLEWALSTQEKKFETKAEELDKRMEGWMQV